MNAFDQYLVIACISWPGLLTALALAAVYIVRLEMKVDRLHALPETATAPVLAGGCEDLGQCTRYLTTDSAVPATTTAYATDPGE